MTQPTWHRCRPLANSSETKPLIDAVLSIAAHYSKISNEPQFTSMHPKLKKKSIAKNTGLLAYTFIKLGDNLTNNDGDILIASSKST